MFENAELNRKVDKATFEARAPALREALLDAQFRLRDAGFSVVVVIAGAEGAGKGDTVNLLLEWLDARGVEVHALSQPSEEERERPEYFRFWRRLPPAGSAGIYFGSWYTRPIASRALNELDEAGFEDALRHIVEFEQMLVDERVLLLKFWLHISKKRQRRRFEKLASDPETAWRVTKRDWKFHKTYDAFVAAAGRALRRTSTGPAPWTVVDAEDSRYRNLTVAEALLAALERRLDAARDPPPATPEPLPAPAPVNLLNRLDLTQRLPRDAYTTRLRDGQKHLGHLARQLTVAGKSAVLVFEGVDAAGKGGCIRRVVQALDARFYRVFPIAAPTDEERARPYLWRFWRRLPRVGHIHVFDRSWYGRVLVERIESLAPPRDWRRAFAEINALEEQLAAAGVLVRKFWLMISEDEQLRRFEARRATGYKRYKLTDEDWRNREKWPAYEAAACEMFERTSSEHAPWVLVEAEDKHHARIKVLESVIDLLEGA